VVDAECVIGRLDQLESPGPVAPIGGLLLARHGGAGLADPAAARPRRRDRACLVIAAGLVLITVRGPRESAETPAPQAEPAGSVITIISAAPHGGRVRHIRMAPRSWIAAGWMSIAAAAGLAVAAIVQVLEAVDSTCLQPLVTSGLAPAVCPGAGAEFVRGLICAVLAGVAFFSGLACFFWAAHLRCLQEMRQVGQSRAGGRRWVFY
jgi:hypothetical protein